MTPIVFQADVRDYLRTIALHDADALSRRLTTLAKREGVSINDYLATHDFHIAITPHRKKGSK